MTKEYTIICNRKRLPVLENLHDALRELRSRREFGYIWIDFICINQDKKTHNAEKSEQVKLMTEIYSKAYEVIIWLGQSDPESVDAIRLISENVDVALTGLLSHEPINFNDPAIFNRYDRKPFNEYQWKAILVLFRRRWFRRVWTLQEVALATRSVAYCGSETFHIDNATVFASFLVNHSWDQRL